MSEESPKKNNNNKLLLELYTPYIKQTWVPALGQEIPLKYLEAVEKAFKFLHLEIHL